MKNENYQKKGFIMSVTTKQTQFQVKKSFLEKLTKPEYSIYTIFLTLMRIDNFRPSII